MKHIIIYSIIVVAILLLSACAKTPETIIQDGIIIADPTQIEDTTTQNAQPSETTTDATEAEKTTPTVTNPTESDNLELQNNAVIAAADGTHIVQSISVANGWKIDIDAVVDMSGIEKVDAYEYRMVEFTDQRREQLFDYFFGDLASTAEHNTYAFNDYWKIRFSDRIGDYFCFEVNYNYSGDGIPQEKIFLLGYHDVNLYPFEDNLLDSIDDVKISITQEEAINMCKGFANAISDEQKYTVGYVRPFGNGGRRQYYWIVYKQMIDGMPVTTYQDLKFYIDRNGIQEASGALYTAGSSIMKNPIISLDKAISILNGNTSVLDLTNLNLENFYTNTIPVTGIALEYMVVKDMYGEPSIVPVWRFLIGSDYDEQNIMGDRYIAVNALNGDLIVCRRRNTF